MNRSGIAELVFNGITEMQKEDTLTDFEVIVGDKSFRCHKIVLAAVSDYFRAMFSSGMKETVLNQTTLEDVEPGAMEHLMTLLYPDDDVDDLLDDKDDEEVAVLLTFAVRLQIGFLKDLCIEHFKDTMNANNCIQRWKMSELVTTMEYQVIKNLAWKFTLDHFEKMANATEMLSLNFDDFLKIIKSNDLKSDSEDTVCKAILNWIQMDPDNRQGHVGELLEHCCLTEVDRDFLAEEVAFMDILDRKAQLKVQEAIKFHRHRSLHGSMPIKFRPCMGKEQVFLMVVKRNTDPSTISALKLVCWSDREKSWQTVRTETEWTFKESFACCVYGDAFYTSGGTGKTNSLTERYSGSDNRIERMASLLFPMKRHAMVAMGDCIYAIGGKSGKADNGQVLKYNIREDTWVIDGELLFPVENASAAALGKRIYIFGGSSHATFDDTETTPISAIQMYDTKDHSAEIVGDLPSPCSFSTVVTRRGHAYVVTSVGDVVKFTEGTHKHETLARIPDFKRENYGVNLCDDKLSIYGGIDINAKFADELLDEIVVVNVSNGKISRDNSMAFPCEVFGFGNIVLKDSVFSLRKAYGCFNKF